MKKLLIVIMAVGVQSANAFDLGDYRTTYIATRDAYRDANQNLRLAEKSLITILNANKELLPMEIASYSKMGKGMTTCSYQKECSEARSGDKVTAKVDALTQDPKLRLIMADPAPLDTVKNEVHDYYNALNSSIIAEQSILFVDQPSTVVWNFEIASATSSLTSADPFSQTVDTVTVYSDYITKRDDYLKKLNDAKLAIVPWRAAQAALAAAYQNYYNNSACSGFANFSISIDEWVAAGALGVQ